MKNLRRSIALAFLFLVAPTVSHADGWAGLNFGPSIWNGEFGTNFSWGGDFGYKISPFVGVGLQGLYTSINSTTTAVGVLSSNEGVYAAELNYYISGAEPGLWVGVRAGVGVLSQNLAGIGNSWTSFAVAPAVGYRFGLSTRLTLGVDAQYWAVLGVSGSPAYGFLSTLASIQFWF